MEREVRYLMSGPAHLPYLTTSLLALRSWAKWRGSVAVYAYPESYSILKDLPNDFNVDVRYWDPVYKGKNGQFINKIKVMGRGVGQSLIYLDADTLPIQDIEPLFGLVESPSCTDFIPTQFNDWPSNSRAPKKRVSRLLGREPICQKSVQQCMAEALPSPNGGVFAVKTEGSGPLILDTWYQWTMAVKDVFIADETVLHTLIPYFDLTVAAGWNTSPKFCPENRRGRVNIFHGHGDCWVRPNKSEYGVSLWTKFFAFARDQNYQNINNWWADVGNRYLNTLMETHND